jgi:flagellar biosynthesis/type III secretory pathway protein FliH
MFGLALAAILALGGILYGQSTRQSEKQVATLVSQRVRVEDRSSDQAQVRALQDQRAELTREHQKSVKRLNRKHRATLEKQKQAAYQEGQSVGYGSGYSSGNTEGFTEGHESGLEDGSDSLTCSDDPDVSWLPYCEF